MDITLEVMLPPRGSNDFTQSAHPKWRVLSIVDVYYPMKITDTVAMQRTGYIHVTGMPFPVTWAMKNQEQILQKLSEVFTRGFENEKREWVITNAADIPASVRNSLRTQRQVTVTWAQIKSFMRNMRHSESLNDLDLN